MTGVGHWIQSAGCGLDAVAASIVVLHVDLRALHTGSSRLCHHRAAHHADVFPQSVDLAGVTRRRPDVFRDAFDTVQVRQPLLDRQRAGTGVHVALQQRQFAIPAVDSRTYTPSKDLRQEIDDRNDDHQQWHQQDDQALHVGGDEERQIAMQQAGTFDRNLVCSSQ